MADVRVDPTGSKAAGQRRRESRWGGRWGGGHRRSVPGGRRSSSISLWAAATAAGLTCAESNQQLRFSKNTGLMIKKRSLAPGSVGAGRKRRAAGSRATEESVPQHNIRPPPVLGCWVDRSGPALQSCPPPGSESHRSNKQAHARGQACTEDRFLLFRPLILQKNQ